MGGVETVLREASRLLRHCRTETMLRGVHQSGQVTWLHHTKLRLLRHTVSNVSKFCWSGLGRSSPVDPVSLCWSWISCHDRGSFKMTDSDAFGLIWSQSFQVSDSLLPPMCLFNSSKMGEILRRVGTTGRERLIDYWPYLIWVWIWFWPWFLFPPFSPKHSSTPLHTWLSHTSIFFHTQFSVQKHKYIEKHTPVYAFIWKSTNRTFIVEFVTFIFYCRRCTFKQTIHCWTYKQKAWLRKQNITIAWAF